MDAVTRILSNPAVRKGLLVAAPEIALAVDLAVTIVKAFLKTRKRKSSVKKLLEAVDARLAVVLEELATTESKGMRKECEIRAHELLGVLNEWHKSK